MSTGGVYLNVIAIHKRQSHSDITSWRRLTELFILVVRQMREPEVQDKPSTAPAPILFNR